MDNLNVLRVGFVAPDFSLPDSSGDMYSLGDSLKSGYTAVCFFPTNPDDKIKSYLKDLNKGLPATASGNPVNVVAVSIEKTGILARLKDELKLKYPVLSDQKSRIAERYYLLDSGKFAPSAYFTVFVIDDECVIRHRISEYPGMSEYNSEKLRETISKLL